jgi:hypothetical protein
MSIVLSFSQNTVQQFTCPYRKFCPSRRAALVAAGFISDMLLSILNDLVYHNSVYSQGRL